MNIFTLYDEARELDLHIYWESVTFIIEKPLAARGLEPTTFLLWGNCTLYRRFVFSNEDT